MLGGDAPTANQATIGNACKAFVNQNSPGPGLTGVCLSGPSTSAPILITAPPSSGAWGHRSNDCC